MKRRLFALASGGATLCGALGASRAFGQGAKEPRRVGWLTAGSVVSSAKALQALREGLAERGFVDGRDIVIEARYASGQAQDIPRLAAEIAALKPVLILAMGPSATDASLAAAPALAIVALHGDFVLYGLAAQVNRPGGRVTGVSILGTPLNAKRLELLAQLLPKGSAVLNLADSNERADAMQAVEAAGRSLGLVMHAAYARSAAEIEAAFASARRVRVAGVNQLTSPFLHAHRARIIELAAGARLPTIYQWSQSAEEGGLMAYGPNYSEVYRQLAGFAARILDGAKPAEMAVEQPTRFELVINLKTAKALGITIPQSLLLRADEVIE